MLCSAQSERSNISRAPHPFLLCNRLQVYIDAANSGEWESCVTVEDIGLPDYWLNRAYVGITATTGALADNHDVISLKTYSDQAVLEADEQAEKVQHPPAAALYKALSIAPALSQYDLPPR